MSKWRDDLRFWFSDSAPKQGGVLDGLDKLLYFDGFVPAVPILLVLERFVDAWVTLRAYMELGPDAFARVELNPFLSWLSQFGIPWMVLFMVLSTVPLIFWCYSRRRFLRLMPFLWAVAFVPMAVSWVV